MKTEKHTNVNVKNMVEEIELRQEESVAAKRLKKVEQQFNGQCLGQEDATYNDEQTSLSPITNENNIDEVNDMLEKRKAIEDREAKAQQLQKAEQRLANNSEAYRTKVFARSTSRAVYSA